MTRAELKEIIDRGNPSLITSDMYTDPLLRGMRRNRENFDRDLVRLYENKALTDEQREKGYARARRRWDAAKKRLQPLEEKYERERWIPMLRSSGILKSEAATPPRSKKTAAR